MDVEEVIGHVRAARARGELAVVAGYLLGARRHLKRSRNLLLEYGLFRLDGDDLLLAERVFRRILKANVMDWPSEGARCGLIEVLRRRQRLLEARAEIRDGFKTFHGSRWLCLQLGELLFDEGKPRIALRVFRRALARGAPAPTDPATAARFEDEALRGTIRCLRRLERYEEAHAVIMRNLADRPRSAGLLTERGWCFHEQARRLPDGDERRRLNTAAEQAFAGALELAPGSDGALQGRIASARELGDCVGALRLCRQARRLRPRSQGILSERGWVLLAAGKNEAAVNAFVRAHNRDGVGWALARVREASRDRPLLERVKGLIARVSGVFADDANTRTEIGWLYFAYQEFDAALKEFDAALMVFEAAPTEGEMGGRALQGRLAALRRLGRAEQALETIGGLNAALKESIGVLSEQAWLHYERGAYGEAEQCFRAALRQSPGDAGLKLSRAETLIRLNRVGEALTILRELKVERPESLEVRDKLAFLFLRRGDLRAAEREVAEIGSLYPGSLVALNSLGVLRFNQGRHEEAVDAFEAVVEADPYNPVYRGNVARALVALEREQNPAPFAAPQEASPEAAPGRLSLTGTNPGAWPPTGQSGRPSAGLGESDDLLRRAAQHCTRALERDPRDARALGCLGLIEFRRGNVRGAEDYFLQSIETRRPDASVRDLGSLLLYMGRLKEASASLLRAAEINRDDAQAHVELARLYLASDDVKSALNECEQAMALNRYGDDAPRVLAQALVREKRVLEAEKVLQRALRTVDARARWRLHVALAQVLINVGKDAKEEEFYRREALKEARRAIELRPDHPDCYFYTGMIHYLLGDHMNAWWNLRKCMQLDTGDLRHEAARYEALARTQMFDVSPARGAFWGGLVIGGLAVVQLMTLWFVFLNRTNAIPQAMFAALIPVLLAFVAVGFILPSLRSIKVPGGVEAEVQQVTTAGPAGPQPVLGFGASGMGAGVQGPVG